VWVGPEMTVFAIQEPVDMRKSIDGLAVAAERHNPVIAACCDRLLTKGKRPMRVVVAAIRKLLHLAFGVIKAVKPFAPTLGLHSTLQDGI